MINHLKAPLIAAAVLVAALAAGIIASTTLYQNQRKIDVSAAEEHFLAVTSSVLELMNLMTTGFSGAWPRARLRTQC